MEAPLPPLLPVPAPHAAWAGAESPRIFFREIFPLTDAFCRVAVVGRVGNDVLEIFGGGGRGPGVGSGRELRLGLVTADEGARNPEAELDAHGVLRWAWRKPEPGVGPWTGTTGGWSEGKREEPAA